MMSAEEAIENLRWYADRLRYFAEELKDIAPNYSRYLNNINRASTECLNVLHLIIKELREYQRQENLRLNGIEEDTLAPESWGEM